MPHFLLIAYQTTHFKAFSYNLKRFSFLQLNNLFYYFFIYSLFNFDHSALSAFVK